MRITGRLYDSEKRMAAENPWRIQDSVALSALFAYRYELTQDPEDLKKAGALADYLLSCQGEDGWGPCAMFPGQMEKAAGCLRNC